MNISTKDLTRYVVCASTFMLFACGGGGVETNTNASAIDPTAPVNDWQLVWHDEFDGAKIDNKKWTHEVNCLGGGNNEKQCYTDSSDNAYLADGKLHIVALPAAEGAEKPYTSARLNSRYKGDFKYGRFEISAKLPSGQGSWPAFWLLPTDEVYGSWPKSGEIDILEAVNLKTVNGDGDVENNVYGTLHYGKDYPDNVSSGKAYSLPNNINPADGFHTYAIEWQEGEIRWYVDNYLYATQRKSTVRYNSKKEPIGLAHRGWFAEYYDIISGELTTYWDNSPFDQKFHILLNLAVGGNWPENVNNLGVDSAAFVNGQHFEVDYVRVYQCQIDPDTGKGCETVRAGYDSKTDALVEGLAPIPSPPSSGVPSNLVIFNGTINPNWPAWDCCGGSTPALVDDVELGSSVEFSVGATPTVNGFISRSAFITDPAGKPSPFDASPIIENGNLSFSLKVVSAPNDSAAEWFMKVESNEGTTAVQLMLSESIEGVTPTVGVWQTYTFPLQTLADGGLDLSAIDVVMVFPGWGTGEGAVYRMTNLTIAADFDLVVFADAENPNWPLWDCCGGSTPSVQDDDMTHGKVAEFTIGATPTVMGFISRSANTASPKPFDASPILDNGVIQFEVKAVSLPNDSAANWFFKVESNEGATAVELNLNASNEGVALAEGIWQTFTFELSDLADAGLDVSAIDVLMIFPGWGTGEGAVYRVDNVKIFDPYADSLVFFRKKAREQWSIWDCCGGSTPTIETDDVEHGNVAEFVIGSTPTVMGILADDDVYLDASSFLTDGVVTFDLKVVSAPNDSSATWYFKIESGDTDTAVELPLTASQEGVAPTVGVWQTYTYSLSDLADAGLDVSAIDVMMFFPAWGTGDGAVYRVDNVLITTP